MPDTAENDAGMENANSGLGKVLTADYDAAMQPPPMGGHVRTEYGVMVDRTSKGLGFFLAETFTEPDRAHRMAAKAMDMFGYPALVQVRRVYVTDWQPCPIPPAETCACPPEWIAAGGGCQCPIPPAEPVECGGSNCPGASCRAR